MEIDSTGKERISASILSVLTIKYFTEMARLSSKIVFLKDAWAISRLYDEIRELVKDDEKDYTSSLFNTWANDAKLSDDVDRIPRLLRAKS